MNAIRAVAGLASRFFRVTAELLFRPGRFFERLSLEGGVRLPVLYAVCTHWLAAALAYGWEGALLARLKAGLSDVFLLLGDAHELGHPGRDSVALQEALGAAFSDHLLPWFWGASSVLLSPFKTLATLAWATGVLFVASRLLISSQVTFRGSLRLACFASTSVLWKAIPIIGPAMSQIMLLMTTVVALKKSYNIGSLRASAVALFPQLLLLALGLVLVAGLGWLVVGGLLATFGISS